MWGFPNWRSALGKPVPASTLSAQSRPFLTRDKTKDSIDGKTKLLTLWVSTACGLDQRKIQFKYHMSKMQVGPVTQPLPISLRLSSANWNPKLTYSAKVQP